MFYRCSLKFLNISNFNISNVIEPFMPAIAKKIRDYLKIKKCAWKSVKIDRELMLENIEPLFERI